MNVKYYYVLSLFFINMVHFFYLFFVEVLMHLSFEADVIFLTIIIPLNFIV